MFKDPIPQSWDACGREGVLGDMEAHGVECVDCISVDNALVRIGDPLFAGYCHERGAECGAFPFLELKQATSQIISKGNSFLGP